MNLDNTPLAIRMLDVKKGYRVFSHEGTGRMRGLSEAILWANYLKKLTGLGGSKVVALDGVTFDIMKGEVFGLLGPNGAGKTTIIKILSTLVLPDSGQVFVDGIDATKQPRRVVKHLQTVLSGSGGFDPRLTGRSNLEFFADLYGLPKKLSRPKIEELLAFAGMKDWADEMFQRYSTGMMRKLLLCRALLSNASILLFDEPTAALDPISATDFRKLIRYDLAEREGKTILLATHNLLEAEQLCDRIALLRKGKIIAVGTPEEIKKRVSNGIFLSIFISNLLPGTGKALIDSLLEVKGVRSVELQDDTTNAERSKLTVEADKEVNYNQIFERISLMRLDIASIESSQPTLEDAFMKINLEATS